MKHDHDHSHGEHGCCGHHHDKEKEGHTHSGKCGHEHHAHGGEEHCGEKEHVHTETCGHGHDHKHDHVHSAECSHEHEHGHDHEHKHVHGPGCCHGHHHDHEDDADAEWTRKFFLILQAVVLTMMGGVICYFVASGRIRSANYLAPEFELMALCGGIGIIVLGLFNLLVRKKDAGCGHDHGDDEEGAVPHSHEGSVTGKALTLLLLSGSLAAAAMLTPDKYTAEHMVSKAAASGDAVEGAARELKKNNAALMEGLSSNQDGLTLEKLEKWGLTKSNAGNYQVSITELMFMPGDAAYSKVMNGQKIETTGQLIKDTANPAPGHMRLFTLQVTCCAADARPYMVPVVFEGGDPDYVDSGWYTVAGKLEMVEDKDRGIQISTIKASSLRRVSRPPDQRPSF